MTERITAEQEARNLLEQMGVRGAQDYFAGEVLLLANLIADKQRLEAQVAAREREVASMRSEWKCTGECRWVQRPRVGFGFEEQGKQRVLQQKWVQTKQLVNVIQGGYIDEVIAEEWRDVPIEKQP